MTITLIRHCEVDENYIGCYNGHIDISLSKNGHKQAEELAKQFLNEEFDSVYCSDLKRARETLNHFKKTPKPTFTDKLREKYWGKYEGKSFDKISENGIVYENFEQFIDALGGETKEEFIQRVKHFFLEYLPKTNTKNLLIVTHSGVIKTLDSILNNLTLEEAFFKKLPYGSVVKYEVINSKYRLIKSSI